MSLRLHRGFIVLLSVGAVAAAHGLTACDDSDPATPTDAGGTDGAMETSGQPATDAGPVVDAGSPIDLTGLSWQLLPELPLDGVRVGSESDVAVDADDHVLVTFGESANEYMEPHSLSVFRFEGTTWTRLGGAPLVDASTAHAIHPRLAVANDGRIYVVYGNEGSKVWRFEDGVATALPNPPVGYVPAITTDSAGQPVVIGSGLVRFDGASWSAPIVPPDPWTRLESVVGCPDGSFVVIARADGGDRRVFTLAGTTWTPLDVAIPHTAGWRPDFPRLGAGSAGHVAAAWSEYDADSGVRSVRAALQAPGATAFAPLGGALGTTDPSYPVVAVDAFARAFIAWRERGIEVSVHEDGAWRALPEPVARGTLPAITLDRRGLPVVSWEAPRDGSVGSYIGIARAVVP